MVQMAWHFGDYYYPEFADTVKYVLKDIFICIITEQCSDQDEDKCKCKNGGQINMNDELCQIK
jgi:hypothetical protein